MAPRKNPRRLPRSQSGQESPAQAPPTSSPATPHLEEVASTAPSKLLSKRKPTPRKSAKQKNTNAQEHREDEAEDDDTIPTDVASNKRPRRSATKNIEPEQKAEDPDFDPANDHGADRIDHPSFLVSQVRTRSRVSALEKKAQQKNHILADDLSLAREDSERREFFRMYTLTNGPVTLETWNQFITAVPVDIRGNSYSWIFTIEEPVDIKQEVKRESKEEVNFKVETHDIKDETGWGGGKADDHTHTEATPTTIRYQQNNLMKEEEDDNVKMEDIARDVSPFRVEPGFWDGLRIPEPNPADEDDSLSETCSGEGESLMSFSDAELEDDYLFQPEPEPVAATIQSIKRWLKTSPSKIFATLQIKEGPKDVFGHTIILFGIPTKFISGPNSDLDFIPYGSEAATRIWDAHYGFMEWKGFREISQALFFRHGGLNSWMYRDLLPDDDLHFEGCSSCPGHCYCWWTNMRNFRRELEEDIINDRMVFWVAQMVVQNSDQLMTVWSNLDEDNPSRRRCIWRDLLRKEDIYYIFEPLRPGVDIQTILEKEEKDREDGLWKQWLYDSAAWLADDIFAYHVSQGKLGEKVPRVVFDRYARIRDIPQFQYVPSLESLPTRGNFKCL